MLELLLILIVLYSLFYCAYIIAIRKYVHKQRGPRPQGDFFVDESFVTSYQKQILQQELKQQLKQQTLEKTQQQLEEVLWFKEPPYLPT
jgi:hypothetical protein